MTSAATFVPAAVAIIAAVVLAGLVGTQLFASAGKAKEHLANAGRLAASTGVAPTAETGSLGARARFTAAPAGDADSQTITDTLNEYYAANISQGFAIFWASLLSMIAGFAIVIIGIALAGTNATSAVVAGVAGVLSQFIAATFLVALRSTQQQSTAYAQNLADLRVRDLRAAAQARSVALGLHLLDEITGDGATELVNQTRAALAMGLIAKDARAEVPAASGTDGGEARDARAQGRVRAQSVSLDETREAGELRFTER